ncbi:ATG C terminal domain-containing protein [Umbelopsis sp. PMI_123]|nr:ATG C terminal domain-containing protein [Umbelopsis sp. PMI_123]
MYDPSRISHQRASSEAGYLGEDFSDTTSQYSQFRNNPSVRDGKRTSHHRRTASSPDSLHPRGSSRRDSRRSKNNRSHSARLEIRLEQINVEFDLLPSTGQLASHLYISVRDFEILDHIKTSMYRKFLSYMRSDMHPRERGSNMIRFELTSVRPVPSESAEEHRLKFRILPMRLYIDQDAVVFLINFFSFDGKVLRSTPMAQPEATAASKRRRAENTTFFQHVEIYPVIMKVDYRPKHVNYGSLKEGQFAEIVNFFHLDAAEMNLSHVRLTGIKGYDRLAEAVLNHWLPHIRDTQLGNVVTGVSSIQSVVNIGSGVADLVLLPVEQYRKDGRIIRGLQRGTHSFARATTMEAIKIGSRLAAGTQVILEQADDFFSPVASNDPGMHDNEYQETRSDERRQNDSDSDTQEVISKFADQPSDLSQGLQHAYQSLSKNIRSAANTVLAVPTEIQESEGPHGTAKAVIRAVPVAVIRPLIGFSEAFANVLVGIRNTIDPGQKIQSVEVSNLLIV